MWVSVRHVPRLVAIYSDLSRFHASTSNVDEIFRFSISRRPIAARLDDTCHSIGISFSRAVITSFVRVCETDEIGAVQVSEMVILSQHKRTILLTCGGAPIISSID